MDFNAVFVVVLSVVEMNSFCLLASMELILYQTAAYCICILMMEGFEKFFLEKSCNYLKNH